MAGMSQQKRVDRELIVVNSTVSDYNNFREDWALNR